MQFKDVCGQQSIKKAITTSFNKGRVHHTQLFLTKPGAGALPLALAYAQLVNCENPTPTDSCGACNACRLNNKLVHPNVHFTMPTITRKSGHKPIAAEFVEEWRSAVLDNHNLSVLDWMVAINAENKQGNITARECSEITNFFKLKRSDAGYRVLIIWGAEALAKEGNRLLKLLEEPSEQTLIILIAEDEERILNTIQSRSQTVRIPQLQDADISNYLSEKTSLDPKAIEAYTLVANGNLRLAMHMANGKENGHITLFKQWVKAIVSDKLTLPKTIEKIGAIGREQLKMLLDYTLIILRESMFIQQGKASARLNDEEMKLATWIAKKVNSEQLENLISEFHKAPYAIERNAHAKIQLMHLSLTFEEALENTLKQQKLETVN